MWIGNGLRASESWRRMSVVNASADRKRHCVNKSSARERRMSGLLGRL